MTPSIIDTSTDGHMHTSFCNHAKGSMEDYVLAGLEKGLDKIIFLEHLETGINYFETTWLTDHDFEMYLNEGARLQKEYSTRIKIGLGVEVGYNPHKITEIKKRLARHRWDRIGVSYHFLESDGQHLNLVSSQQKNITALDRLGVDEVIATYFQHLQDAVLNLPGTVLCHFDAVLRYHPEVNLLDNLSEPVDRLLDAVASKKMAVEVNTSGFRIRNEPYPSLEFLKKIVRRGIPLVAASDAHRPEDVGRYFDRLDDLNKKLIHKI